MSFNCQQCESHSDGSPIVVVTERREKKYTNTFGGTVRESLGHEIVREMKLCAVCEKAVSPAPIPFGMFQIEVNHAGHVTEGRHRIEYDD